MSRDGRVLDGVVGMADMDVPHRENSVHIEEGRVEGDSVFLSQGPSVRTRRFVILVAVVLLLVLVGMAQVWVRLRIVRMGYDLSTESRKAVRLERMEQKLEVEQAVLRRPERLKEAARSRLGLREPVRGEVVVIDRRPGGSAKGGF